MIKSSFNKPYLSDDEMKVKEKVHERQVKFKSRLMANTQANQIFQAVVDAIENTGKERFTKAEMIALVTGERRLSQNEKMVWDIACDTAIRKIRLYFWPDTKSTEGNLEQRMFQHVRDMGLYWLIPVEKTKEIKLAVNVVYEEYDRKMQGIKKRLKKIAGSAYLQLLDLDKDTRNEVIKKLREQKLLNGDH